ncbi:CaiB/BaiF CoA transferase family protein [Hydrogenophaga sp. BPS33]|uniref:CaiB/BaiF CoA transferase family protein n=1 Tax=Hydrogenophaga sp. BPS33 TaxID=2651974 RepID=UPI00131F6800|nr:CoA transferase [Hydrogenophaga sp. BPS33]QHE85560.1 CoA transferase [Hydrogenophaga sp. BPS33]
MTSSTAPRRRPALDGIRILDLSRVLAGPWCTMVLGDLGADVIKIENPQGGDDTRGWGPYKDGESAYYLCTNRNKRSVALDLASPEGQATVRALVAHCDVVVENFKAGALERFGLDRASLEKIRPDLIWCSISGYGRQSPLADRAGYDYVVQAEGGLMSITGEPAGEPMKVGVAVADLFTGMYAVQAILAALIARRNDGQGQNIDLALFDCQLTMLANVASATLVTGQEPQRFGNAHASVVPYQVLPVRDGEIVLAVGNDRQFKLLCDNVLQRPEIAADARFTTNRGRLEHRDALIPLLSEALRTRDAADWLERLSSAGIPCGQVRSVGAALASPEAQARGMVSVVQHPKLGPVSLVSSPIHMDGTPVRVPSAPPMLGEHTEAVLRELLGR